MKKSYDHKIWLTRKEEQYQRQYEWRRRKSKLYQDTIFTVYGGEYLVATTLSAAADVVDKFNTRYGDTLTPRHGVLILMIKHWCLTRYQFFTAEDMQKLALDGAASGVAGTKSVKSLVQDLVKAHFLNINGSVFTPTTRLKQFCVEFNHRCEELRK